MCIPMLLKGMASQVEHVFAIARRLCIGGSLIGSIKETQEMLNLCGEKNITCDVEVRRRPRANPGVAVCMACAKGLLWHVPSTVGSERYASG